MLIIISAKMNYGRFQTVFAKMVLEWKNVLTKNYSESVWVTEYTIVSYYGTS
jgi:hypothetical protein